MNHSSQADPQKKSCTDVVIYAQSNEGLIARFDVKQATIWSAPYAQYENAVYIQMLLRRKRKVDALVVLNRCVIVVPLDRHGVILSALKVMWERNKKFRKPDDLVFANRVGKPLDRRNILRRNLKPVVKKLNLPRGVDFRSFRTMHGSMMRRMGRLEIARDNMGHGGNTGSITLDVYSKTWWEERVETVTRVVEMVMTEPEQNESSNVASLPREGGELWEPFWEPQGGNSDSNSSQVIEKNGRGERI